MKRVFFAGVLLVLAGCGNLSKLNDNMERSNEMIQGNTTAVQRSSEIIHENTCAVKESTKTLAESKAVIAGGTALLQQMLYHPFLFIVLIVAILLALSLPSFILYIFYRRLSEKVSTLLDRIERK